MVLIILMILKYVTDFNDENGDHQEDVRAATESETNPLCLEKAIPLTYGTWEEDVETGSCSSGEDLYDGRICVICYDEQRNCFFVPCGYRATCYDCAQRYQLKQVNVLFLFFPFSLVNDGFRNLIMGYMFFRIISN